MDKALLIGGPYDGKFHEGGTSSQCLFLPDPDTMVEHKYRYCQFGKEIDGNRVLYNTYVHNSLNLSSITIDFVMNKFMGGNENV